MSRIALFASGTGSNALKIIEHFEVLKGYSFLVISNRKSAGVLQLAKDKGIEALVVDRKTWSETDVLIELLKSKGIEWIALAGFLWLLPNELIEAFSNRIVNIHPSLLPKYGGKGMFGRHVHEKVVKDKEQNSGMTIHLVNSEYDKGELLFQASVNVLPKDNAETLARKVLQKEHKYYSKILELLVQ